MKVFKFGGASVKDADAIRNVGRILSNHKDEEVVVVISAMGKSTNALERLADYYFHKNEQLDEQFKTIRSYHQKILKALFDETDHPVYKRVRALFEHISDRLAKEPIESFNYIYDQIVPTGELLSTTIVSAYLTDLEIANKWLDARGLIRTDDRHREANVLWDNTIRSIKEQIPDIIPQQPVITQGFIGGTEQNESTTLGREGSDYTAAIIGAVLDAEEVIVWKDVPGVLTADPKQFDFARKINRLSYYEAIEMTYYGAKVLHPKTIKPLENKLIPLQVRSFIEPEKVGTLIEKPQETTEYPPIVICKRDQVLYSIITKDYSFISEKHLSMIYGLFAKYNIKVNMMQIAAISFSACVDNKPTRLAPLTEALNKRFKVLHNEGLDLLTIRHYHDFDTTPLLNNKEIYLEQRSRHTLQLVTD